MHITKELIYSQICDYSLPNGPDRLKKIVASLGQQWTERALTDYNKGWNRALLGLWPWSMGHDSGLFLSKGHLTTPFVPEIIMIFYQTENPKNSMIIIVKHWYWKFKDWFVGFEARSFAEMALLGSNVTSEVRIFLVRLFRCIFLSLFFQLGLCNVVYFWKFWVE